MKGIMVVDKMHLFIDWRRHDVTREVMDTAFNSLAAEWVWRRSVNY